MSGRKSTKRIVPAVLFASVRSNVMAATTTVICQGPRTRELSGTSKAVSRNRTVSLLGRRKGAIKNVNGPSGQYSSDIFLQTR